MKHAWTFCAFAALMAAESSRPTDAAAGRTIKLYGGVFEALQRAKRDMYDMSAALSGVDCSRPDAFDAIVAATSARDHYRLRIRSGRLTLASVTDGRSRDLAAAALPASKAASHALIIKRRRHFLSVVWDGRLVLSAMDSSHAKGVFSVRIDKGVKVIKSRYQPVEPIVFEDGFMVTEAESKTLGTWKTVSGDWTMHSVIDTVFNNPDARIRAGHTPEPERSVNPFSLSGLSQTAAPALIVNGEPFWDDYRFSASAKALGGEMGLVFDYRDPKNYHVFRWRLDTEQIAPGRAQLVRVRNGKETVLGERYVEGRRDNWYLLTVQSERGRIEASIDHTPVFVVNDADAWGGRIGLYALGRRASIYDDVDVRTVEVIEFRTARSLSHTVRAQFGQWSVSTKDGFAALRAEKLQPAQASLYIVGDPRWQGVQERVDVDASALKGKAGLVFGYQGPKDYWIAFVDSAAGRAAVARIAAGRAQTLASAPLSPAPRRFTLIADTTIDDALRVYVNDQLAVRIPHPGTIAGRMGVAAAGAGSAAFTRYILFKKRDTDWERGTSSRIFAIDPYMQGWASRRWEWKASKPWGDRLFYEHKGDFFGAFRCRVPVSGAFSLRFGEDAFGKAEKGYAVDVALLDGPKACRITLRRAGRLVKTVKSVKLASLPAPPPREITNGRVTVPTEPPPPAYGPIVIHREDGYIWVDAGGKELFNYFDPHPLTGRSVAMIADKSVDLNLVDMKRDHVLDYLFERAPRDWLKIGEWKVTNRFACDPRWSHMNGRSRGLAALWNKYALYGDFTIECYAGIRMHQGELKKGGSAGYPRVGDINLCLCGDERDLWTGYNFVLQGWDKWWSERWTRLFKRERVVAKTDKEFIPRTRDHYPSARVIPVPWDPGGRAIHGAWYFLKIRKRGGHLDMTFDAAPVLSYDDPKPLAGGHVALWTQDSSIVVARMKLSYERRARGAARFAPKPKPSPPPPPEADPIEVSSLTHPSLVYDFETGFQGWHEAHMDQGAVLSWEPRGKGHCLRLTNAYPGGEAGAEIPVQPLDLGSVRSLRFDYRVEPGALVNLYFQLKGDSQRYYFVRLTGPADSGENMRLLAAVPDAKADGKWRTARVDIASAIRRFAPERRDFVLARLFMGCLHEGYVNAGLGGNKAGATFYVDNFSLVCYGPSAGVVEWKPAEGRSFKRYAVLVDRSPTSSPALDKPVTSTVYVFRGQKPGEAYFHIRGQDAAGKWSRTVHYPLFISAPLTVASISPPSSARWGGDDVRIAFDRASPAQLIAPDTWLSVNGKTIPFNPYAFRYDAAAKTLTLRLNRCGLTFADGARVNFLLRYRSSLSAAPGASSESGVEWRAAPLQWSYVMDRSRDHTPPSLVRTDRCLVDEGFEMGQPWRQYGESRSELVRDTSTAASGEASLKLVVQIVGGRFNALVHSGAFSAGQYPLVSFDYKTIGVAKADLVLHGAAMNSVVRFTDNDASYTCIGACPGVQTDGKWRHTEFNLKRLLDTATTRYTPRLYEVRRLLIGDTGHTANPPGSFFHIDNFRISSVLGAATGLKVALTAADLSGIAGYSFKWSAKADDAPDHKIDTTTGAIDARAAKDGALYLHAAAQDRAGNWGPVAHYRFIVDKRPPAVAKTIPADKSLAASPRVTAYLSDAGSGIDPTGIRIQFNGRQYSPNAAYTLYNPKTGEFSWDWVKASPAMVNPIPDKSPMTVSLSGIHDFAGNTAPPVSWTWKLDYSKDHKGPARPGLTCLSATRTAFFDFAHSLGYFRGSGRVSVQKHFDPERQDWCLRAEKTGRGIFWVYAYRRNFYTATHPVLSFDYKFPPGLQLSMALYLNGQWRSVELTCRGRYTSIGKFPGIVADGKWRHAVLNLHELVKPHSPGIANPRITYIAFMGGFPNRNPVGAVYFLDNFCIAAAAPAMPRFSWRARDETGVAGVSYELDRRPDTIPDEKLDSKDSTPALPVIDAPGLWYLHLRARDGAGNWGQTEHFPYFVREAPAAAPDGLEAQTGWEAVSITRRGRAVLSVVSTVSGKNKLLCLHREGPGRRALVALVLERPSDLRGKQKMVMDICNESAGQATVYLQVRTGPRREWHMTQPKTLPANAWTRALAFNIGGKIWRTRTSHGQYAAALAHPEDVREIRLRFYLNDSRGALLLDRVRFE